MYILQLLNKYLNYESQTQIVNNNNKFKNLYHINKLDSNNYFGKPYGYKNINCSNCILK